MSSGIKLYYKVINADSDGPPLTLSVGVSWASGSTGNSRFHLSIWDLAADVSWVYDPVPGLTRGSVIAHGGGQRRLAKVGVELMLREAAHSVADADSSRYISGYGPNVTVAGYLHIAPKWQGLAAAQFGIDESWPLISQWPRLAVAITEYAKSNWSHARLNRLNVIRIDEGGSDAGLADRREAIGVLAACAAFADDPGGHAKPLAYVLRDRAIATWGGSDAREAVAHFVS